MGKRTRSRQNSPNLFGLWEAGADSFTGRQDVARRCGSKGAPVDPFGPRSPAPVFVPLPIVPGSSLEQAVQDPVAAGTRQGQPVEEFRGDLVSLLKFFGRIP